MRKLWKNRPLWIALIALILLVILTAFTLGERSEAGAQSLFAQAALPVQRYVSELTDNVSDFFTRVFTPSALEEENAYLKAQVNEYARLTALYEETARENARLSEILDYSAQDPNVQFLTASVVARSTNAYVDTLTLNVGLRQGVAEKMAVIAPGGVVGRVVEVGTNWCKVKTLLNDDLRLSVLVESSRDEGMLGGCIWSGDTMVGLQLYYLPANAQLSVGDTIVTSGLGGLFPKGLKVGTVLSVSSGSETYDACVVSEVDFAHLEEVMVVLGVSEGTGE